jgi:rhomboid protease GluP
MSASPGPFTNPNRYQILRETWLTRKPRPGSGLVAIASTFAIAFGSLVYEFDLLGAASWMPATRQAVYGEGEHWRLLTTLFAHGDLGHIAANSFLFTILGFFLYGYFGLRVFPFFALLGGALTNLIVLRTYQPEVSLIGASGVVYWMGGAWLVLYFFLSRQKNFTNRILRTIGVSLILFMPAETFAPNVSYRAHFVGFALGALFGIAHFLLNREKFRAAEVREWIIEDDDPEFDLPPPEGFPVKNGEPH